MYNATQTSVSIYYGTWAESGIDTGIDVWNPIVIEYVAQSQWHEIQQWRSRLNACDADIKLMREYTL